MSETKSDFKFGLWPRIWFILCIIGGFVTAAKGALSIAFKTGSFLFFEPFALLPGVEIGLPAGVWLIVFVILLAVGLVMAISYLNLLRKKKKSTFFVILAAVVVYVMVNAAIFNVFSAIGGVIQIVITLLTLRPYWKRMS